MKAAEISREMRKLEAFRNVEVPYAQHAVVRATRHRIYSEDPPLMIDECGKVSNGIRDQNTTLVDTLEYVAHKLASPLVYQHGNEFSFLIPTHSQKYTRRVEDLCSYVSSLLTYAFMSEVGTVYPACFFTSRCYLMPTMEDVEDYFSWRRSETENEAIYQIAHCVTMWRDGMTEDLAHSELRKRSLQERKSIIQDAGVELYEIPSWVLFGTFGYLINTPSSGYNPLTGEHETVFRPRMVLSSFIMASSHVQQLVQSLPKVVFYDPR